MSRRHQKLQYARSRFALIAVPVILLLTPTIRHVDGQEIRAPAAGQIESIRKRLESVESEFGQLLGVQEQMVRSIENSRLLSGCNAEAIEELNTRVGSLQQQVSRLREERSAPTVSPSIARRERERRSVQLEPVTYREESDRFSSYSRPQPKQRRRSRSVSYDRRELPGGLLLISSGGGFAIETGPMPDSDWMMEPALCGPPVGCCCPCCAMPW